MSLKAFHVFFMAVSILFCAGFGAWAVLAWRASGDPVLLGMGLGTSAGAIGLVFYARWFLRKWKRVSYL